MTGKCYKMIVNSFKSGDWWGERELTGVTGQVCLGGRGDRANPYWIRVSEDRSGLSPLFGGYRQTHTYIFIFYIILLCIIIYYLNNK